MRVVANPAVLAPIGGVEMSTLQVNRELAKRGHSISALFQEAGSLSPQWQVFAEEMVRVPTFDFTKSTAARDLYRLRPAVRAAAAAAPDVIYLNRAEQSVWGLLAGRASRAPLVTHLRTLPDFPGVGIVGRLTGAFIAISGFVRDQWIQAGLRPEDVTLVHNGIDPADYPVGGSAERAAARAALDLSPDAYVVLYYGRVAPGKGVEVLLDAWRALALPPEHATLLIAGGADDGEGHFLRSLQDGQPPGCRWLPLQRDVVSLLHAADVVTLPAEWQEPFGRVVIEGLASGRPVVGTTVGGIPEILTGEFRSLLVEPGDRRGLAARLGSLHQWRTLDPGHGVRCSRHALGKFSLTATVDGVEGVLRAAVTARNQADRRSPAPPET
jgi:glycosyltransferase involved in cell wall biosynthesis